MSAEFLIERQTYRHFVTIQVLLLSIFPKEMVILIQLYGNGILLSPLFHSDGVLLQYGGHFTQGKILISVQHKGNDEAIDFLATLQTTGAKHWQAKCYKKEKLALNVMHRSLSFNRISTNHDNLYDKNNSRTPLNMLK